MKKFSNLIENHYPLSGVMRQILEVTIQANIAELLDEIFDNSTQCTNMAAIRLSVDEVSFSELKPLLMRAAKNPKSPPVFIRTIEKKD